MTFKYLGCMTLEIPQAKNGISLSFGSCFPLEFILEWIFKGLNLSNYNKIKTLCSKDLCDVDA